MGFMIDVLIRKSFEKLKSVCLCIKSFANAILFHNFLMQTSILLGRKGIIVSLSKCQRKIFIASQNVMNNIVVCR